MFIHMSYWSRHMCFCVYTLASTHVYAHLPAFFFWHVYTCYCACLYTCSCTCPCMRLCIHTYRRVHTDVFACICTQVSFTCSPIASASSMADGSAPCTERRSMPRPTEHADGACRRSVPTERADGACYLCLAGSRGHRGDGQGTFGTASGIGPAHRIWPTGGACQRNA